MKQTQKYQMFHLHQWRVGADLKNEHFLINSPVKNWIFNSEFKHWDVGFVMIDGWTHD